MDVTPVIDRLKAQLSGARAIGGAADFEAATSSLAATPSVFVLPLAERAVAMDMTGLTQELITQRVGVVQVVKNARDAKGAAALVDLAGLRAQVRAALVGWVSDASTGEPMHFVSGALQPLQGDGLLWWMDEFELKSFYWSA